MLTHIILLFSILADVKRTFKNLHSKELNKQTFELKSKKKWVQCPLPIWAHTYVDHHKYFQVSRYLYDQVNEIKISFFIEEVRVLHIYLLNLDRTLIWCYLFHWKQILCCDAMWGSLQYTLRTFVAGIFAILHFSLWIEVSLERLVHKITQFQLY